MPAPSLQRRSTSGSTRAVSLVLGVAAVLIATSLTGCRPAPRGLAVSTYASGLNRPWDLAFDPSGNLFITERPGSIRYRPANASTVRTLGVPAGMNASGEGGLLGVAVDPSYRTNRRIYVCFRSVAPDVRVVRFTVDAAATTLSDRADLVTGIPTTGRHNGCRIRFGPDGYLWIGTGDAAVPTNPQSPTSLGGKVLRVTTSGAPAPGNAKAPFDPRIYTYGHRNVQGLAFSPGGKAYSIEHGTSRDDEINRLYPGANYGWDPRPLSGPSFYDESRPMTDLTRHPDARRALWSSGSTTIAPSGGTFVTGSQWSGWSNSLAVAVLKGEQLRVFGFTTGGDGTSFEQEWVRMQDRGRLRVVVQGPDGALYVAQDANPGAVLRVTPTG